MNAETPTIDQTQAIEWIHSIQYDRDGESPHRFIRYGTEERTSDDDGVVCAVDRCPTDGDGKSYKSLDAMLRHPIHAAASYAAGLISLAEVDAAGATAADLDPTGAALGRARMVDATIEPYNERPMGHPIEGGPDEEWIQVRFSRAAIDQLREPGWSIDVVGPPDADGFSPLRIVDTLGRGEPIDRDSIIRQNASDALEMATARAETAHVLGGLIRRAVHREYEREMDVARDDVPLRIRTAIEIVLENEMARLESAERDARSYVSAVEERRTGVDRFGIPF